MKVLNFGSLNLDYVYQVESILIPGETQASKSRQTFCGGKGLNQSIALAKAGIPVYHAGLIGEGGEPLLEVCKENGVNAEFIRQIPGPCGHTVIQVDRNGQNCILLFGGSNRSMTKIQFWILLMRVISSSFRMKSMNWIISLTVHTKRK